MGPAQGPVYARRAHLEPGISRAFHFQHKLQLAGDFFAIFRIDELLGIPDIGLVDRDAQQTTGGALDVHQFVTQSRDCLLNRLV